VEQKIHVCLLCPELFSISNFLFSTCAVLVINLEIFFILYVLGAFTDVMK